MRARAEPDATSGDTQSVVARLPVGLEDVLAVAGVAQEMTQHLGLFDLGRAAPTSRAVRALCGGRLEALPRPLVAGGIMGETRRTCWMG